MLESRTPAPRSLGEAITALRRGEPGSVTRIRADGEVELMVPQELALAWTREAAERGTTLDRWTSEMVGLAPGHPVAWEAAAAASGLRLTEWGYACALRRTAISSA